MKIDKTLVITSVICLLPIVLGVLLYDRLPALIPVHFNFADAPNSWGPKGLVVFGIPVFLCLNHHFIYTLIPNLLLQI